MDKIEILDIVRKTAPLFNLSFNLVAAVIEQESGFDPWAMRYEPAFLAKYVAPLYTNNKISATEAYARAMSWGLLQVMGQVARENGFEGRFLSELCDPKVGIKIGCAVLNRKLNAMRGDVVKGLLAWNGGGNPKYAEEVIARMPNYT